MLEIVNATKRYKVRSGFRKKTITALDGVSLRVGDGLTIGLVGESGSGKSTLVRTILGLIIPDNGYVRYGGDVVNFKDKSSTRAFRRSVQAVFQDPHSSLNPRMRIGEIVSEPLLIYGIGSSSERKEMVADTLHSVGIDAADIMKYPHEFSGGQRQRISIARALILSPSILIADEPLSSLDVSIQAQILNLLMKLRKERGFSMLFISHDLRVVRHIADNVAVLYRGKIVEESSAQELFASPQHDYTRELLGSLPEMRGMYAGSSSRTVQGAIA